MAGELRAVVEHLAAAIGPRAMRTARWDAERNRNAVEETSLETTAAFLERRLGALGCAAARDEYEVNGTPVCNLVVTFEGMKRADEVVIVGAHYDTVPQSPGANDNATGVAALLAVAADLVGRGPDRTVRLLFFVNEENPYGSMGLMGSQVYARRCRERGDRIVAMISLDSLGYYDTSPGSQQYPWPLSWMYPSSGDFIGFVSDLKNAGLLDRCVAAFRAAVDFPSEGLAMDIDDVGRSDHSSFWREGYPGIMMTDSANFRDAHYHQATDSPARLDFDRLSRVADGLRGVVWELATVGRD
jgi:Zn-dependent M28 family amino/carboxypeptidase